jgi:hypothetical protein
MSAFVVLGREVKDRKGGVKGCGAEQQCACSDPDVTSAQHATGTWRACLTLLSPYASTPCRRAGVADGVSCAEAANLCVSVLMDGTTAHCHVSLRGPAGFRFDRAVRLRSVPAPLSNSLPDRECEPACLYLNVSVARGTLGHLAWCGSDKWCSSHAMPCCAVLCRYGEELLKNTAPIHLLWSGAHYDLLLPQPISKL